MGGVVVPLTHADRNRGAIINDVVVDPSLGDKLRDHQREGVQVNQSTLVSSRQFMYRCVMGMSGANGSGCILADEMGLGKTLQTIALIHTLLSESTMAIPLTA